MIDQRGWTPRQPPVDLVDLADQTQAYGVTVDAVRVRELEEEAYEDDD